MVPEYVQRQAAAAYWCNGAIDIEKKCWFTGTLTRIAAAAAAAVPAACHWQAHDAQKAQKASQAPPGRELARRNRNRTTRSTRAQGKRAR